MLKASDILYEDGKYWIYEGKKKGFTLCRENGVCADIVDIANGYRNSYVDSQDKDELLRAVADKYLKATEMVDTITLGKIENIRELLGDIEYDLQSVIE